MPTPEATPALVIYEPSSCNMTDHLGNSKVLLHGWHGSGVGNNWCNLCRCNDGAVSCQKRKCGTDGLSEGTVCSHTKCEARVTASGHQVVSVNHCTQRTSAACTTARTCRAPRAWPLPATHSPSWSTAARQRALRPRPGQAGDNAAGGQFQDLTGTGTNNDVQRWRKGRRAVEHVGREVG